MPINKIYSMEPVYFKKLQVAILITILPAVVLAFLRIGVKKYIVTYIYALLSLFILTIVIIVFYLNRNEISMLTINDEDIYAQYVNKSFFKRKPFKEKKISISATMKSDNIIYLYHNKDIAFIIRKEAVEQTEWQEIREYFQV